MNDGKMWVYVEIQGKRYWGNLVEFEEALDVAAVRLAQRAVGMVALEEIYLVL